MSVRIFALICVFSMLGAALPARAQQTVLEVIPLKYRTADQVIPVLQPLMAPRGTITGLNNQLVLRTTPENLAQLKQVLATLDATPRQLVVSVRQDSDLDRSRGGAQVSGQLGVGDHAGVSVPGRPTPPGATVSVDGVNAKAYSSDARQTDRVAQQVRVLEGSRAFIRMGQSVPVRNRQVIDTPNGRRVVETTGFSEAASGFYVLPRLAGDRVTLQIFTANDSMRSPATGATNIQQVQTVVSARLGEWVEIGGIGQQGTLEDSQVLGRSTNARSSQRGVMLKVDEVR
jgi:type II secretory pathway component GspD/PulD (secretin)